MRGKLRKMFKLACDAFALLGFFTFMYFLWIATGT